jgi:hypothetical protein
MAVLYDTARGKLVDRLTVAHMRWELAQRDAQRTPGAAGADRVVEAWSAMRAAELALLNYDLEKED